MVSKNRQGDMIMAEFLDNTGEIDDSRIPISDFGLKDADLLSDYSNEIALSNYSSAVKILDDAECNKGIRASLFNEIKSKLLKLELYFLNLKADEDTLYALEEPIPEQMGEKKFWIQPLIK